MTLPIKIPLGWSNKPVDLFYLVEVLWNVVNVFSVDVQGHGNNFQLTTAICLDWAHFPDFLRFFHVTRRLDGRSQFTAKDPSKHSLAKCDHPTNGQSEEESDDVSGLAEPHWGGRGGGGGGVHERGAGWDEQGKLEVERGESSRERGSVT